jgi:hypothetical protein
MQNFTPNSIPKRARVTRCSSRTRTKRPKAGSWCDSSPCFAGDRRVSRQQAHRPQALQQQKAALEEDAKGLKAELDVLLAANAAIEQESALLTAAVQEAAAKLASARVDVDAMRAAELDLQKQLAVAAEENDAVAVREAKLQVREFA